MGTRRKGRECALQILFAADLVRSPEDVLTRDYWGEIGFEELHRGANRLAGEVIEDLDKIESYVGEIKSLVKKIAALGINSTYGKEAKELTGLVSETRRRYTEFIRRFVTSSTHGDHNVYSALEQLRTQFNFSAGAIRENLVIGRGMQSEERSQLSEIFEQAEQTFKRLAEHTLPAIEKMMEEVAPTRVFTDRLAIGALKSLKAVDDRIRTRAEHWRIERMAIVDRNILRLAVYEFLYEDTPHTVVINEALEIARRFSTFEATQFINGILDAIKHDLENKDDKGIATEVNGKSQGSSL